VAVELAGLAAVVRGLSQLAVVAIDAAKVLRFATTDRGLKSLVLSADRGVITLTVSGS